MQLSYNGRKFIEESEGFRNTAYKDGGGVWTIGYGTTHINGKPVEQGMRCTMQEADMWIDADTAAVQTSINKAVKLPLTQNQFDALVSFTYNVGIGAFLGSTLLKMLNMGAYKDAAAQFQRWDKDGGKVVPGLHARRLREAALFQI